MLYRLISTVALALPLTMAVQGGANAAPQILGVIASAQPTVLHCAKGECVAQLTTFCLTEHRASPNSGTPYRLHNPAAVKLVGYRPDGSALPLDAGVLSFASARSHLAVNASLPQKFLKQRRLASVSITIGADASLIPEPWASDPKPLTPADIALATGPLRSAASHLVNRGEAQVEAAQLATLLINALPSRGRADPATRTATWQNAVAGLKSTPSAKAMALVSQAHEQCRRTTEVGFTTLRQCIGAAHDGFMGKFNRKHWYNVSAGS